MNILHIIDTTGPGGAETVFLNLIQNLDKKSFYPFVVLRKESGWVYDEVKESGIEPEVIKSKWSSFDLQYLLRLILFVKKKKINIIHSHLFGSNVYCSIVGMVCCIPVISTFHGTVDTDSADKLLRLKFRLINRGSTKVVFVSEHLKQCYFKNTCVDKNKSVVIYNGIDTAKFTGENKKCLRKNLGYSKENVLIGSIGNIRSAKGYDILLKTASILKKDHPHIRFLIVGEGKNELFKKLIRLRKSLGVENTVNFLGFRANVSSILKELDIFLLPSTSEGFSISTIEAMASGVPVIVTDSGGPGEIVTHEKDGLLVPPNSPEAIAKAIDKYITSSHMLKEIAKKAQTTVAKNFSINRMIETYVSLYNRAKKV